MNTEPRRKRKPAERARSRLRTLTKMQHRLAERLETYREDGDPSHLAAEVSALSWAIRVLKDPEVADIAREVE